MLRFSIIIVTAFLSANIAQARDASPLVNPSSSTRDVEKGVIVFRGKPTPVNTEKALAGNGISQVRIREKVVIIQRNYGWPPRRLRVQGFTNGRDTGRAPSRRITRGFFADRIAAGY